MSGYPLRPRRDGRFNPLPDPKAGEIHFTATILVEITCFNPLPDPKAGEMSTIAELRGMAGPFQSAPRPEGRGDGGVLGALCCNTLTSPFREPLPSACSEPCHPRATAEREPTGCASIAGGSRCLSTP